jgi:hypothetical protein
MVIWLVKYMILYHHLNVISIYIPAKYPDHCIHLHSVSQAGAWTTYKIPHTNHHPKSWNRSCNMYSLWKRCSQPLLPINCPSLVCASNNFINEPSGNYGKIWTYMVLDEYHFLTDQKLWAMVHPSPSRTMVPFFGRVSIHFPSFTSYLQGYRVLTHPDMMLGGARQAS